MKVSFVEIFEDVTKYGAKISKDSYLKKGKYPIIDQGQNYIAGYSNEKNGVFTDVPAIIFGDHTRIIKYIDFPCFLGADGVKLLKTKNNIWNYKYLYYSLCYSEIPNTGYNRHYKYLKEISINYYGIDEQTLIANKLDKINHLIDIKKTELIYFEQIVKSRFIEMFGDLYSRKFTIMKLGDCCVINPKKTNDTRLFDDLKVSFVPMSAISDNGSMDSSSIDLYKNVKKGFTYFAENDVVFAKITPCMENGKGAIAKNLYNKIGFGTTELHIMRPKESVSNPYWLYQITAFNEFRKDAESKMTGSAGQRRVPASFLQNFKVSVPPIEPQNEFAEFVKQTDKSKFECSISLNLLESFNYYNHFQA